MIDSTQRCTVLERKDIGDGSELVLCDQGEEHTTGRFVTWSRNLETGATHHGTYYQSIIDAGNNFTFRVEGMLEGGF